jgi:hypothetical protein
MGLEIARISVCGTVGITDLVIGRVSDGVCGGVTLVTALAVLDGSGCGIGGGNGRASDGVCGSVALVASLTGLGVSLTNGRRMPDPLRS